MASPAKRITEKDPAKKLAIQRLTVLQLAEKLGCVSEACRRSRMDRTSFYEWKRRFQTHYTTLGSLLLAFLINAPLGGQVLHCNIKNAGMRVAQHFDVAIQDLTPNPLRRVSEKALRIAVDRLNDRPRKCLGYRTPHEVFTEAARGALAI